MFNLRNMSPNKKIIILLLFIFLLNTMDGILTLWGIRLGAITEANPFMQPLISGYPSGMLIIKMTLPLILGLLIWQGRHQSQKLISYSLRLVASVYIVVNLLHVHWIWLYY